MDRSSREWIQQVIAQPDLSIDHLLLLKQKVGTRRVVRVLLDLPVAHCRLLAEKDCEFLSVLKHDLFNPLPWGTSLTHAIGVNKHEHVTFYLDSFPEAISVRGRDGRLPIHRCNNFTMLQLLIERKADLEVYTKNGHDWISYAAYRHDMESLLLAQAHFGFTFTQENYQSGLSGYQHYSDENKSRGFASHDAEMKHQRTCLSWIKSQMSSMDLYTISERTHQKYSNKTDDEILSSYSRLLSRDYVLPLKVLAQTDKADWMELRDHQLLLFLSQSEQCLKEWLPLDLFRLCFEYVSPQWLYICLPSSFFNFCTVRCYVKTKDWLYLFKSVRQSTFQSLVSSQCDRWDCIVCRCSFCTRRKKVEQELVSQERVEQELGFQSSKTKEHAHFLPLFLQSGIIGIHRLPGFKPRPSHWPTQLISDMLKRMGKKKRGFVAYDL